MYQFITNNHALFHKWWKEDFPSLQKVSKYYKHDLRPTLINIHSNEPLYYQFTVSVCKCGGSCNTIDDSYAWA